MFFLRVFIPAVFLFSCPRASSASGLRVTDVRQDLTGTLRASLETPEPSIVKANRCIIINSALAVRNVELVQSGSEQSFRLPLSFSGRVYYSDIRILSRRLYDNTLASISKSLSSPFRGTGTSPSPLVNRVSFTVGEITPLRSPKRVANVEVFFEGELLVRFGLLKTAKQRKQSGKAGQSPGRGAVDGYRLLMPSVKGEDGKYHDNFIFLDYDLRRRVEKAVIDKYREFINAGRL